MAAVSCSVSANGKTLDRAYDHTSSFDPNEGVVDTLAGITPPAYAAFAPDGGCSPRIGIRSWRSTLVAIAGRPPEVVYVYATKSGAHLARHHQGHYHSTRSMIDIHAQRR